MFPLVYIKRPPSEAPWRAREDGAVREKLAGELTNMDQTNFTDPTTHAMRKAGQAGEDCGSKGMTVDDHPWKVKLKVKQPIVYYYKCERGTRLLCQILDGQRL